MNKFWLTAIFLLCLVLAACSNQKFEEFINPESEVNQEKSKVYH